MKWSFLIFMRELAMMLFAQCLSVLFQLLKIPQTKASWVNTDEVRFGFGFKQV